ncbi:MFS transporter [Dinghuibacter silviterrae]|uniref:Putative MFS family arabinose efflux permease n=1 Tax=Dinghuibacter silviterrae TaxID=1539049 RepID=A0A4R8DSZ3_9BACT|nr:MFS transporter [Dinghuibacter silviterrae]TDX00996.1 putative MFS family arabinose efflux permease [Dinghuibacter silviterrae]
MKRSIYVMAVGAFGIITTEFGVIGILPELATRFRIPLDTAGWLISGFALTVALFGPLATKLTARVNRKVILCSVLAVFVVSNGLSALAPNFTVLMIARILPAFLHPVFWAVSMSVAAKQVGPKDAPKALAIIMGGLSVATVLGVPVTTYAATLLGWQASFLVAGIINLAAFGALAALMPSLPVRAEAQTQTGRNVLASPQLWIKLLTGVITVAGMFATYGYLAGYLDKVTHMSGVQVSVMLLVFGATGIVGNWLTGIALSKNVQATSRWIMALLVVTHVLAYSVGGLFIPMVILLSVWGFIHTGGLLMVNLYVTHDVPHDGLEAVNSFLPSAYNAGITLGTLLGGFVIAHYGVHQVIWASVPLLALAWGISFSPFSAPKRARSLQV